MFRSVLLQNISRFSFSQMCSYDTIVVGLGAAGMTAASTLAKAGKRVLGLEADNRIGGRVRTVPFGDGVVELGAEWIHGSKHNRVYELATENDVSIIEQDFSSRVYRSDGSVTDTALMNELLDYCYGFLEDPPAHCMPVGEHITERLMEYLKEKHPNLLEDEDFVGRFLELMDTIVCGYLAANDWNDISSHSTYEACEGHQHLSWHKHGYETFFQILLNKHNDGPGLPTLATKLNKEVNQIKWPKDSTGDVEVTCKDGDKYTANNVIVTVSLGVLKERYLQLFSPSLPQEKINMIQTMSIGVLGKIILQFPNSWWESSPYTSLIFLWTGKEKMQVSEKDSWLTRIFGCSIPKGSENVLTVWISGDVAKLVETLPEDVVRRKSMQLLRMFLGKEFQITEPTGMIRSDWYTNPFTRGSYTYDNTAMFEHPNARYILGAPLLDSDGNVKVLFAGEATDCKHYSTVQGATNSGYQEAMRLLGTVATLVEREPLF